jgi:predicted metal-dependent enzyme (double-stranded beta helix superfamily)
MSVQQQRNQAVTETLAKIKAIAQRDSITRDSLEQIAIELKALAAQPELFPTDDFAPPQARDADSSTRYLLHKEPDETFALYLNSINPGKNTAPHNHTTWAVIAAVEGDELNRVYERVDDGSNPERAELRLQREVVVSPGTHVAFLADDIHSIHVVGDQSTRHFHLYGRSLDLLTERVGYDLETGAVVNYNKRFHRPTHDAR